MNGLHCPSTMPARPTFNPCIQVGLKTGLLKQLLIHAIILPYSSATKNHFGSHLELKDLYRPNIFHSFTDNSALEAVDGAMFACHPSSLQHTSVQHVEVGVQPVVVEELDGAHHVRARQPLKVQRHAQDLWEELRAQLGNSHLGILSYGIHSPLHSSFGQYSTYRPNIAPLPHMLSHGKGQ